MMFYKNGDTDLLGIVAGVLQVDTASYLYL